MKSKWCFIINSLKDYCIGEDKNIYRKPIVKSGKSYSARLIRKQNPNRYILNGSWWSEKQLRRLIVVDENPIILFTEKDLYF